MHVCARARARARARPCACTCVHLHVCASARACLRMSTRAAYRSHFANLMPDASLMHITHAHLARTYGHARPGTCTMQASGEVFADTISVLSLLWSWHSGGAAAMRHRPWAPARSRGVHTGRTAGQRGRADPGGAKGAKGAKRTRESGTAAQPAPKKVHVFVCCAISPRCSHPVGRGGLVCVYVRVLISPSSHPSHITPSHHNT